MGKRGPAPEPTKLKILKGNPGKRALNDREPEPELGIGPPPDWLSAVGKAHWAKMVDHLAPYGLLTVADWPLFTQMCVIWADWQAARDRLAENDRIYVSENGYSQVSGWASDERALRQDYFALAKQFGMSPSGRSGIKLPESPSNAEDDFLFGTG